MSYGVPHRILAVDDVPSNLLVLQAILPKDEFTFLGVSGADDAFRLLEEREFDLILLDVLLPGLDGYSIARRLKSNPKTASLPLIFLTALTDENEVIKGFESGGVDFVSKPFRKTELLLRLRTHLALKDKNEALERAAHDLRLANQARDRFFSILAHDLKNPFAGIQSLVHEILQQFDHIEKDDLHEALKTMGQTSQNVSRLLETLLDWGRSQTGNLQLDPQLQPVQVLVDEALEPLEDSFHRKGIAVVHSFEPLWVWADRYTVVAILRNLLSNAVKFTRPGGSVTLTARRNPDSVEISVCDTGVGMPPSRLEKLFRLDNKISTPGTAREPGTGLGLLLCSEFTQRNGGTLRVESRPEVGTTFFLVLPGEADEPAIART